MALKPLNSGYGFSVGVNSIINVVDVNANVTANVLTVDTYANLGNVSNIFIGGGTAGQYIQTDGNGNLSFSSVSSNSAAPMPYFIPNGQATVVPFDYQGLFAQPIEIDGQLEVDGILIDVSGGGVINATYGEILYENDGVPTGINGFVVNTETADVNFPANIRITGNVVPFSNNISDLGSNVHRWGNLYLSGNTIYIGNSTIETDSGSNLVLTSGTGASLVVAGNAEVTTVQNGNTNMAITGNGNINFSASGTANIVTISSTGLVARGNVNFGSANQVSLGPISNVYISGGSNGQILTTDGYGNLTWSSSPSNITEIQHGSSNVSLPDVSGNVYINTNGSQQWNFDTTGNLTAPANGTANLGNLVTANYVNVAVNLNANGNVTANYLTANNDFIVNGNANVTGNINLSANSLISDSTGSTGTQGQVLTSNGTNTVWASTFYYGPTPPDFATLNYGDIFFYIDNPNNFQRLYMWVTDGSSSYFYDFLPPSF